MIGLLSLSIVQPVSSVETDNIELNATKLGIATRFDSPVIDLFITEFVKSDYAADVGITSINEITLFTPTTYESFHRAMTATAFEVSLGWGGSSILFDNLAKEGAIKPITNQTFITEINNTIPIALGNSKMRSYDDNNDLLWVATSFSSYGFTVNHDVLQARELPVPIT